MNLFTENSFDVFTIEGLDQRMAAIRSEIQPIFQRFHALIIEEINSTSKFDHNFHIAQHLRRSKNPPESTWCAFGGNSRGYKKYPHLQIMINPEYIFIGLAMIDNPTYEHEIAKDLLTHSKSWEGLEEDFKISRDHTKTPLDDFNETNMIDSLERVIKVKKGEIMLGRIIKPNSDLLNNADKQLEYIKKSYLWLMPVYRQALEIHLNLEKNSG